MKKIMNEFEAVRFCENTECEDCPVFKDPSLDIRSEFEDVPCFMNLVREGNDEY